MKQLPSRFLPLLVVLAAMMITGCFSTGSVRKAPYYLKPPPGCVAINDTLWYDRTEITNMDWLEYLSWIARVYGKNHELYNAALPDTNVWKYAVKSEFGEPYGALTDLYLRHPAYYDYPVVGISQQQALAYSQWRSDRVYEMILVKYGVLVHDWSKQTPENHFTIERFQRGEFEIFNLPDAYLLYPVFRLPEPSEYAMALHYDDSVKASVDSKTLATGRRRCNRYIRNASIGLDFFLPARFHSCNKYHNNRIINLSDNVAEWLATPESTTEAGYYGNSLKASVPDSINTATANAWTGFRNVVIWKLFLHDTIIGEPVKDIDGNSYKTVKLGNNLWMAENLRTTRLNDGSTIGFIQVDTLWAAVNTPAYCWYNDTIDWPRSITGAYYNRYAMETGKLCPEGWRIPSLHDWQAISDVYGGKTGGALKVTGFSWWQPPNRGATNATGFSAYPTGTRFPKWGFSYMGIDAFWWSTTRESERFYYTMALSYRKAVYQWMLAEANHGVNVRCVKIAGD